MPVAAKGFEMGCLVDIFGVGKPADIAICKFNFELHGSAFGRVTAGCENLDHIVLLCVEFGCVACSDFVSEENLST